MMANCPWQWLRANFPKRSRELPSSCSISCRLCSTSFSVSASFSFRRCTLTSSQSCALSCTFSQVRMDRKKRRRVGRLVTTAAAIAAILQLQKVTLPVPRCPWPMPPTSLHCGRLPVAVASLQVSLCQAYRFLLRFHQKTIKNPWKIHPGGSLGVPRPPQRGPGAILSSPEGSQSGPGPSPRLPRAPREPPQGPRGRPRDGP